MDLLPQTIASGLSTGVMFALVAIGFALIFNSSDVINFAQGEFVMVGGFTYLFVHGIIGASIPSAVLAVALMGVFGAVVYLTLIRSARRASVLSVVLITLGLSVAMQGTALVLAGPEARNPPPLLDGPPVRLLGAVVTRQFFWLLVVLVVIAALLWFFFNRSTLGRNMLACAMDRKAAALMGIDADRMVLLSWILGAALAGLAGVLVTPLINVVYNMGLLVAINGFAAAAIGGVGRFGGAIVGGLTIGLANSMAAAYAPMEYAGYASTVGLLLLLLVLVVRPKGLFGGREERRHTAQ